jgi:hypothetical protein
MKGLKSLYNTRPTVVSSKLRTGAGIDYWRHDTLCLLRASADTSLFACNETLYNLILREQALGAFLRLLLKKSGLAE